MTEKPFERSMREIIFGAEDGLVSMLGLVSGVAGGHVSNAIIILAGFAGMIAAAISMAAGAYISTKSQTEVYSREIEREKTEIQNKPREEEAEVREIYRKKGFRGKELEMIVKRITSDKKMWLDIMMKEELGLGESSFKSPITAAIYMGLSFIIVGSIPILPFFFSVGGAALKSSVILTMIGLFLLGAWKTQYTKRNWLRSGIEMVMVGLIAAGAGYVIGNFISSII